MRGSGIRANVLLIIIREIDAIMNRCVYAKYDVWKWQNFETFQITRPKLIIGKFMPF